MPCLQLLPPSPSVASVSEAWVLVEILHIRLASIMVSAPVHKIFISDFIISSVAPVVSRCAGVVVVEVLACVVAGGGAGRGPGSVLLPLLPPRGVAHRVADQGGARQLPVPWWMVWYGVYGNMVQHTIFRIINIQWSGN